MIVLGLTGAIGSGKSTVAGILGRLGASVYDADAAIHRLLSPGSAAAGRVRRSFGAEVPEAFRDGGIDRRILGSYVFERPESLGRLEAILHPLVGRERRHVLRQAARAGRRWCVLDVPLLFETGSDRSCDAVIVTCAPLFLRRQRAMRRPGMTVDTFEAIRRRQMPEDQRQRKADWTLPTGLGYRDSRRRLLGILRRIDRRLGKGG